MPKVGRKWVKRDVGGDEEERRRAAAMGGVEQMGGGGGGEMTMRWSRCVGT